ncbi:MAG: energy-coupled thiamine transporter ThiT [Caldisericia bacterium]
MNLWETITEWVSTNLTSLFPELNFWVTIIVVIIIVAGIVWFVVSAKRISWKPSLITEIAIACALSLILGFLKIVQMPEGGSISLAMLPVIVVAFRRGLVPGVVTGIIAGLLQMICDPFFIHPLQVFYLITHGMGCTGFSRCCCYRKIKENFTWDNRSIGCYSCRHRHFRICFPSKWYKHYVG